MSIEQEIAGTVPATLEISRENAVTPLPENAKWSSAGIASLLSEDPMDVNQTFGMLLTDFDKGNTDTLNKVVNSSIEKEQVASKEMLLTELSNRDTTLERKKEILSLLTMQKEWQRDSSTIVSEKLLAAPSSPAETVEQETRRTNVAELLKPVHEYRSTIAALRNGFAEKWEGTSTFHKADSFFESLWPYATTAQGADEITRVRAALGQPKSVIANAILPGNAKQEIRNALERMPPELAITKVKELANELKKNSGLLVRDENNLSAQVLFDQLTGDYSKFDKFIDNTMILLDSAFFITPALKAGGKTIERAVQADKLTKMLRNSELMEIVDKTATRSAAKIAQSTNPDKARSIHRMVVETMDDGAARATYGASREEAITADLVPQPNSVDGSVEVRVPDIDKKVIEIDPTISDAVNENVSYRYTDAEMRRGVETIVNDFHNAEGLHINPQMSQFGVEGDNVVSKAVYGNTEGGFLKADEAIEKALVGLRKRGIKEDEITLLENKGGVYEPVAYKDVKGKEGDFLVQVKSKQNITDFDVQDFEKLNVVKNVFDRLPVFQWERSGNLQRWFVDAASMLNKHITGSASVAIDRAASLDKQVLHYFDDFAKDARRLKADRQDKLMAHIVEANAKEIELSPVELAAQGFTSEEVAVLNKWRRANDVMFYLENADLVKTLRNQGYKLLDDGEDRFFAKEVSNAGLKENVYDRATKQYNVFSVDVYDPASKAIIKVSEQELDNLYANGGTFARFRRPVEINGQMVEHIKVENTATNYLKGLRDTDQVLNYKKGWFHVEYNKPLFVVQKVKDITGKTYEKRVAVAGSRKEAEQFLRHNATKDGMNPEEWGYIAEDKKALMHDGDSYWDIQSSSGRVAQRHRGKRLEGKTGTNLLGKDIDYVVDPIESSIKSARSISARISTRPVLETAKARFKQQYAEFLPSDNMGGVRYPSKISEIKTPRISTDKDIADARTTWHFINQLENGYINTMDEGYKWLMNMAANILGKAGATPLEKGAYALSKLSPASDIKGLTYYALIATNPLRQFILQPLQALRLFFYSPQSLPGAINLANSFLLSKVGVMPKVGSEAAEFIKFLDKTGIMASVDRHNLVRGSLASLADSSHAAKRLAGKAFNVPRKIGFDLGEQNNMLMTTAIAWSKKKGSGANVFDKRVMEEIHSESRALSYDMNIAGDMPYNQNWASVLTQFAQVPHKAVLQLTNRRIDKWDRVKLAVIDTMLWGVPAYGLSEWVGKDMTPDDKELRAIVTRGIFDTMFNKLIINAIGPDAVVDFKGSFSPYDWGWAAVASSLLIDKSFADAFANTPSGRIFFGENSRVGQAFDAMSTFLHAGNYGDSAEQWRVAEKFLRISSGFASMSDAYKAAYIREAGQQMTKEGVVLDSERSNFEILMSAAGIQNMTVQDMYKQSELFYNNKKRMEKEVGAVLKESMRHLADLNQDPNNSLLDQARILGEMERVYAHDPQVLTIVQQELKKAVTGKDKWLIAAMLKEAGRTEFQIPTLMKHIEDSPAYSDKDKQAAKILMEDAKKFHDTFNEKE